MAEELKGRLTQSEEIENKESLAPGGWAHGCPGLVEAVPVVGKHPWAMFWGSVVLFPCFFLPVASQLSYEAGRWIVWVGILVLLEGTVGYVSFRRI